MDFFLKKSRLFYTRKLLGIKIAWNKHYHGLTLLLLLQLWPLLQQLVMLYWYITSLAFILGLVMTFVSLFMLNSAQPILLYWLSLPCNSGHYQRMIAYCMTLHDLYEIILCKKKYIFNAYILVCMCILIGKTFRAIVQIWF